jgi:hypothetical protein
VKCWTRDEHNADKRNKHIFMAGTALGMMTFTQLFNKGPSYMKPKFSTPLSKKPDIGTYHEPDESSLHVHILFLEDFPQYYPSICVQVSQLVSIFKNV